MDSESSGFYPPKSRVKIGLIPPSWSFLPSPTSTSHHNTFRAKCSVDVKMHYINKKYPPLLFTGRRLSPPLYRDSDDFRRFITISHTFTGRFLWYLAKWLTPARQWIHNVLDAIRQTFGSGSGLIQIRIPDHVWLIFRSWRSSRSLSAAVRTSLSVVKPFRIHTIAHRT